MATSINVNKQSVKQLLEGVKKSFFVIPEYQRPYAWTEEQIETLFEDLWEFASTIGGTKKDGTYFLGSIVSYENEKGEQEIIDGQQRITSLLLLLRAIYTKLQEDNSKSEEVANFKKEIEPAIWKTDKLTGKANYSQILLESRVINNKGNDILRNILETGVSQESATDNYSVNYRAFQSLLNQFSEHYPLMIYDFIYALLNQVILLPITTDSQNTALTIFSTLNDRGLPLSDADIFKAKIYNHLENKKEKEDFIANWKKLDERAIDAQESIQQLFYYYMFYLRAIEKDNKTTTPGLRKYYSEKGFSRLYDPELLKGLNAILNIWEVVNKKEVIENELWSKSKKILQILDALSSYPNEFWKYPVIIYYLVHRKDTEFKNNFLKFLRKLFSVLISKYLLIPTISAVKTDILKLNVNIIFSDLPSFDFKDIDSQAVRNSIKVPSKYLVQMILKILVYNHQKDLLPSKWEIEHILPRKWKDTYFEGLSKEVIEEKIEHIGNKIPLEKKLNIIAGNGYFGKKKEKYAESSIAITRNMAKIKSDDWCLDDIVERDIKVSDEIMVLLNKWNKEYAQ